MNKLYRVDITLSYLCLSDKTLAHKDAINWVWNTHEGEFDDAIEITEVKDSSQIEDFDDSYTIYGECDDSYTKKDAEFDLALDIESIKKRLANLGYEVKKIKNVRKAKQ